MREFGLEHPTQGFCTVASAQLPVRFQSPLLGRRSVMPASAWERSRRFGHGLIFFFLLGGVFFFGGGGVFVCFFGWGFFFFFFFCGCVVFFWLFFFVFFCFFFFFFFWCFFFFFFGFFFFFFFCFFFFFLFFFFGFFVFFFFCGVWGSHPGARPRGRRPPVVDRGFQRTAAACCFGHAISAGYL